MAAEYVVPKLVQAEKQFNSHLILDVETPLTFEEVVLIRSSWNGVAGLEWSNRILTAIEERANIARKGTPMTENRDGTADTAADLFTVINTALDALQDLLGLDDVDATEDVVEAPIEMNSGDTPPQEKREESLMVEERKSLLATAERITMSAEVRSVATDDGSLKIAGYAATFNKEAENLSFREQIAPGAFTRSLESSDPIFLLVNHNTDQLPLASTASGTLKLSQDKVGLRMEADLDSSNPRAAELASALSRGDVNRMSFSITIAPGGETRENAVRTITDCTLYEVSVVHMPAYDSTSVGMRSAEEEAEEALQIRAKQLALKVRLANLRK